MVQVAAENLPGCGGCLAAGRGCIPVSHVRRTNGSMTYHCWTCAPPGSWWASDIADVPFHMKQVGDTNG